MMYILWLVLAGGYGVFTWAAGDFSRAALCFLNGCYLALLCFVILPETMGTAYFFPAALAAGGGIMIGFWQEKRRFLPVMVFAAVMACHMFCLSASSAGGTLLLAFLGGVGLYHASASIIPDKIEIGKALLSGAGFLCGTILFCSF